MIPLVIEFAEGTSLHREQDLRSDLPIVRNGPPGTFVICAGGLRVSLPTDQIVSADDTSGAARVGFGGMRFAGIEGGRLIFLRVHDLQPEEALSPDRSWTMTLDPNMVASVVVDGAVVWPVPARS